MKKVLLLIVSMTFFPLSLYAEDNCAAEKRDEYQSLLKELKDIDIELAMEAKTAYGTVVSFEEFDDKEPRCFHIDRLLKDMRETIKLYK